MAQRFFKRTKPKGHGANKDKQYIKKFFVNLVINLTLLGCVGCVRQRSRASLQLFKGLISLRGVSVPLALCQPLLRCSPALCPLWCVRTPRCEAGVWSTESKAGALARWRRQGKQRKPARRAGCIPWLVAYALCMLTTGVCAYATNT